MQRRGVNGRPGKRRRTKRPKAPKASSTHASIADLQAQLDGRTRERDEALEQWAATTEVLKVISHSTFDLQSVLTSLLRSAGRLCRAENVQIFLRDGEVYRLAADNGFSPEYQQYAREHPIRPGRNTLVARTALEGKTVHIPDVSADPEYTYGGLKLGGYRTLLGVPLIRDGKCIGVIALTCSKVQPFTGNQIELVTNFAAQAVIAIENTRLLNELRQSLEQQTATADVLKVISGSPGTLDPVFGTMLAKATELCEASYGTLWLHEGDGYRAVAMHGDLPPIWIEQWRSGAIYRPGPDRPMARATEGRQPIQIADMRTDPSYLQGDPLPVAGVEIAGIRTLLLVPMFKESEHGGLIAIYRTEVLPFTEKQIDLVKNFAAQAVIAIENARLLNELRQRTDDLAMLEQQTATSEVLKVISSSPGELEPVFNAMLESAVRLCEAKLGTLFLSEGKDSYRNAALYGAPPAFAEARRKNPVIKASPGTGLGRVAATKEPVQILDIRNDPAYTRDPSRAAILELAGARTMLNVPMLKDNELVGQIGIYRQEVRSFTDKQIELVKNFAAQAVIAIENARLLNELRGRTRELATSLEDLRNTQDRLVQTQKLASLGQLTAGIAHEIKNPLNFVNNFSGVSAELVDELQEALKDSSLNETRGSEIAELMGTLRSNLDKVVQHGQRADAIVKNMLLHSHQGSGEHRSVAINAIVEESLKLAYHGARAEKQNFNIMVEQSFDPVAGEADIFPQEITRVLLNLISNGVYATRNKALPGGQIYKPTLIASTKDLGDRVEIRIRDNGTGIPPDVKEKMFNPFFTTKPAGEGTGLGLSITHDIVVKQHGGSIEIDTKPGEFTEVRIVLPRTAASISS